MRLERLADERARVIEKREDLLALAEEEQRDLADYENEQITKYRTREEELDAEIVLLATDIERVNESRDVSRLVRSEEEGDGGGDGGKTRWARPAGSSSGPVVYRSFAEYARDKIIVEHPQIAERAARSGVSVDDFRAESQERLERALSNVTSTGVAGLIIPTHMTQIMDIIDNSRPVVSSGRAVPLDRGSMTYPKITQRPNVTVQSSEKSEGGTVVPQVSSNTLTANSYLGAVDISWQALNWSTPDVLQLYLDLAAEAYARQTENVACDALEDNAGIGTVGTASGRLGTAGTESFGQWRTAVIAGLQAIDTATGSRHRTNALYLSGPRFFQLAALGTDQVLQMSPVGSLDIGSMTGNFFGLRVIGSYGFDQDTAIVGDTNALFIGENPGSPVNLRVVEPDIAGMQVGIIGAFNAVVFDANRFYHLGTHL